MKKGCVRDNRGLSRGVAARCDSDLFYFAMVIPKYLLFTQDLGRSVSYSFHVFLNLRYCPAWQPWQCITALRDPVNPIACESERYLPCLTPTTTVFAGRSSCRSALSG